MGWIANPDDEEEEERSTLGNTGDQLETPSAARPRKAQERATNEGPQETAVEIVDNEEAGQLAEDQLSEEVQLLGRVSNIFDPEMFKFSPEILQDIADVSKLPYFTTSDELPDYFNKPEVVDEVPLWPHQFKWFLENGVPKVRSKSLEELVANSKTELLAQKQARARVELPIDTILNLFPKEGLNKQLEQQLLESSSNKTEFEQMDEDLYSLADNADEQVQQEQEQRAVDDDDDEEDAENALLEEEEDYEPTEEDMYVAMEEEYDGTPVLKLPPSSNIKYPRLSETEEFRGLSEDFTTETTKEYLKLRTFAVEDQLRQAVNNGNLGAWADSLVNADGKDGRSLLAILNALLPSEEEYRAKHLATRPEDDTDLSELLPAVQHIQGPDYGEPTRWEREPHDFYMLHLRQNLLDVIELCAASAKAARYVYHTKIVTRLLEKLVEDDVRFFETFDFQYSLEILTALAIAPFQPPTWFLDRLWNNMFSLPGRHYTPLEIDAAIHSFKSIGYTPNSTPESTTTSASSEEQSKQLTEKTKSLIKALRFRDEEGQLQIRNVSAYAYLKAQLKKSQEGLDDLSDSDDE